MLLQYTGAMSQPPQYDASWVHHYEDERDAAWRRIKRAADKLGVEVNEKSWRELGK